MSYATLADLQAMLDNAVLVDLTDDDGTGTVDTTKVTQALETADVEIDAYLGERYPLPLTAVPAIVTKVAADLAIFNLYARRSGPPEHWQKRYDNAIRLLDKVRTGELSLGATDPQATGSSDEAAVSATTAVFSSETLKNY